MSRSNYPTLLFITCLGMACDSVPDPNSSIADPPPQIEGFTISPQRVVYALLDESSIEGDSVQVAINLSATVQAFESGVGEVFYAVISPDNIGGPLRSGTLSLNSNGVYTGTVEVILSALDVQAYPVIVYVVDIHNRLGGEARTTLEYVRSFEAGSPPMIDSLSIPDRIQRPPEGEPARSLSFITYVSDPDGLSDIELVEFWNENAPGKSNFTL